jgi:hypothetical protein
MAEEMFRGAREEWEKVSFDLHGIYFLLQASATI